MTISLKNLKPFYCLAVRLHSTTTHNAHNAITDLQYDAMHCNMLQCVCVSY